MKCSCVAFPAIQFCKHLAAVEFHYPSPDSMHPSRSPQSPPASQHLEALPFNSSNASATSALNNLPAPSTPLPDPTWDRAHLKFQALATRINQLSPTSTARFMHAHQSSIGPLEALLDTLSTDLPPSTTSVLPAARRLPPNILNKTETQAVLPRAKESKTERKRKTEADPFGGGEQPGKLAKRDAKGKAVVDVVAARRQPLADVPNGQAPTPGLSALSRQPDASSSSTSSSLQSTEPLKPSPPATVQPTSQPVTEWFRSSQNGFFYCSFQGLMYGPYSNPPPNALYRSL